MSTTADVIYRRAIMQDHVYAKALANFIFRQVTENAHCKYQISQEDMKEMCKEAVNRAEVFIQILENNDLYRAFAIEAIDGIKWDEPELTEDLKKRMEFYRALSQDLNANK